MKKKNNLKSLDQFVEEQYGKKGTAKRDKFEKGFKACLLYTSPSPRDRTRSRMPSSA